MKDRGIEAIKRISDLMGAVLESMEKMLEDDRAEGVPESFYLFTDEDIAIIKAAMKVLQKPVRIMGGMEEACKDAPFDDLIWMFNKGLEEGNVSIEVEAHFGHGVVKKLKGNGEAIVALIVEDDDGNGYRVREADLTSMSVKAKSEALRKALSDALSADVAGSA
jgi:hypothetical protein